jgi:competence protein ComEA
MNEINKKQKIIIILIGIASLIGISYFLFFKEEDTNIQELENISVTEETKEKEENSKIMIHIAGAVQKEGILELDKNSRIADAIEKAGGLKEEACLDNINLAEILEDGSKIDIPTKTDAESQEHEVESTIKQSKTQSTTKSDTITSQQTQKGKININTASQSELENLPGIGPSTASKIIEYRKENGKFKSIENIKDVKGIGDSKYNKIKDYITVN